jgi:glucose/arabinose dehydrogenase
MTQKLSKLFVGILLLGGAVFSLLANDSAQAIPAENSYKLVKAFPNLTFTTPVDLQVAPDSDDFIYVVEQPGEIHRFERSQNTATKSVFLDIKDRVVTDGGEEGLLGLAFHPDFATNRFFYVNYTAESPLRTVVSRFTTLSGDPTQGDPASELVLLEQLQPFSNHNGGQIAFGADGFLYIALGDGGSAGDPNNHGQDLTEFLGSMLRIDVDIAENGENYGIPPTNPFVGEAGKKEEIYAYGLRNPWRFSFDNKTSRIYAADVGQNEREEIDLIANGKNYGWPIKEGTKCFKPELDCGQAGLTKPVHQYTHAQGESITGGFVYRGTKLLALRGAYIYADFVSGKVWALRLNANGKKVWNVQLLDSPLFISSLGRNAAGELYLLSYGDGKIYRLKKKKN